MTEDIVCVDGWADFYSTIWQNTADTFTKSLESRKVVKMRMVALINSGVIDSVSHVIENTKMTITPYILSGSTFCLTKAVSFFGSNCLLHPHIGTRKLRVRGSVTGPLSTLYPTEMIFLDFSKTDIALESAEEIDLVQEIFQQAKECKGFFMTFIPPDENQEEWDNKKIRGLAKSCGLNHARLEVVSIQENASVNKVFLLRWING